MFKYYLIIFLFTGCVSYLLTPWVRRLSIKMNWLDKPNWRKINKKPMPIMGGLAIFLGFMIGLGLFFYIFRFSLYIGKVGGLALGALLIVLAGMEDDIRRINAFRKLFYQIVAAIIAYIFGFTILKVSNPLGQVFYAPAALSMFLTVFWIIGLTNAFNLLDGLDGLASGVCAIISASLFFAGLSSNNIPMAVLSILLCGASLGFLPHNFYPAKIFMGDTGSMFLGFTLSLISIEGAYKGATFITIIIPMIAMAVPILDTGLAIFRRVLSKKGVFSADKEHVHHKLLFREGTQKKAVLALYALTLCFGFISIALIRMSGLWQSLALILTGLLTLRWAVNSGLLDFIRSEK